MTVRGLAAFLIRILGIILAYYCFVQAFGLVIFYRMLPEFGITLGMVGGARLAMVLTPFVILISAALCLIVFPAQVYGNLVPLREDRESQSQERRQQELTSNLEYMAVSLLALYLITNTLLYAMDDFSKMALVWSEPMFMARWVEGQVAQIVWVVTKLSLGIWGLLNIGRVVTFLRWSRGCP